MDDMEKTLDNDLEDDSKKKKKNKSIFKVKKIGVIVVLLVIILIGGGIYLAKTISDNNFKLLKKNYGQYVITSKNAILYNSNKKEIGVIKDSLKLELVNIKNITKKNKYIKVKGTDYYVYYKNIKKSKKDKDVEDDDSYYLDLGINIVGTGKIDLYKNKKLIISLNDGINASVKYMDENNYYVNYLNDVYRIKKSKNIKEKNDKDALNGTDKVSVFYYNSIDDNCGEDTCFKVDSVKAHIEKIKDNGFYTITKDDYIAFINGYIKLKENAVLFATGSINDNTKRINDETGVSFAKFEESDGLNLISSNKPTTYTDDKSQLNYYNIKRYFVIDDYVKIAKGEEYSDNGPQTSSNQGIAVVNYHFFYDSSIGESCNESICLETSKFREQLQWLKDNGYKTLTIKEFADWMDGIIELPEKSVLLTVDDGAMGTGAHNGNKLIPILEEYQMYATLFLIAGWWDINNYQSKYLDVQSHTFNLHYEASCADGRGMVACSSYQEVKDDLQQSIDIIKDTTSFCFPFYSYDRESLQAIEELGFRTAFIGGNVKARRSNNKLLIPRYPIISDITLNEFIYMVS